MNVLDFAMDPQQALDAPRFRWVEGSRAQIEDTVGTVLAGGLAERGHDIVVRPPRDLYGHGQIIWRGGDGFVAGTEPRCDGAMAMY